VLIQHNILVARSEGGRQRHLLTSHTHNTYYYSSQLFLSSTSNFWSSPVSQNSPIVCMQGLLAMADITDV